MTNSRLLELADHLDMTVYNAGENSGLAINKAFPVAERVELVEFLRELEADSAVTGDNELAFLL